MVSGTRDTIHDNRIQVQELPQNQEYNACELSGAYAIQLRSSHNTEIYGNTATSYADQCEARGIGLRTDPPGYLSNINIYRNTFNSAHVGVSAAWASNIEPEHATGTNIVLHNNTFIADTYNYWDFYAGASNLVLDSNTIVEGSKPSGYATFAFIGSSPDTGMKVLDSTYQNGASGTSVLGKALNQPETSPYNVANEWRLHLTVTNSANSPIPNAHVTVQDSTGATVVATTTAADGTVVFPLVQNVVYNSTTTAVNIAPHTPHTITVSATGYTTTTSTVTMNSMQNLTIQLPQ